MRRRTPAESPSKLSDVARLAGVSLSTVSNVLNHPTRVEASTRTRVEAAISELGFTPNRNARALVVGTTDSIGLVVFDLKNSLFVDIARGAQRRARGRGYSLQVGSSDSDVEQQAEHLRFFDAAQVSGLILAPMHDAPESVDRLRSHGRPVVIVNHDPAEANVCRVLVDNEQAGFLAVRHLIECGARRLGIVAGRRDLPPVELRVEGAHRAARESAVPVEVVEYPVDGLEPEYGDRMGSRLAALDRDERPDAVLAVTDMLAMTIISRLTAQGIRVPDDIRVMGCDHNTAAWGGAIPLSSVSLRGEALGEHAVDLLLDEIDDPAGHVHETITIGPSLHIRESTVGRPTATPPA